MKRILPALAAGLVLAAVAVPAHADVKGNHMQSANIQAMPGQQLDSASVKAVYCDLKTTGLNHVTLNPVLIQDTPTSRVITKRKAKKNVEPTATDVQFRQAIRNARACGLGVVIAPHLELVDHSWRAKIPGSDVEFREWTKWLLKYQGIGLDEGADTLIIGIEQKGMTAKGNTARWLKTIAALRAADPGRRMKLTYAAHTGDELLLLDPKWVKKLDYISATWYPRVPKEGATYGDLKRKLAQDHGEFKSAKKRYGKRIVLAETGLRSIAWDDRFAKTPAEVAAAKVDLKVQERWFHALLHTVEGWSEVDGVMLYRTMNATTDGGAADTSFSWQGKPAEKTIAGYFGGKVPR